MTADPYQDIYPPEEAVDAYGAPPPPAAPDNPYGYPHVEPVQGYGDRLALALRDVQMPQFPTTRYQGQPSGAGAAFLTGLLTGGAQGYSGNRVRQINEREKLNAALAQKAHDENVRALAATAETTKARRITAQEAQDRGWPADYVGRDRSQIPVTDLMAKPIKKAESTPLEIIQGPRGPVYVTRENAVGKAPGEKPKSPGSPVAVVGANGKAIYVTPENAIGKEPAKGAAAAGEFDPSDYKDTSTLGYGYINLGSIPDKKKQQVAADYARKTGLVPINQKEKDALDLIDKARGHFAALAETAGLNNAPGTPYTGPLPPSGLSRTVGLQGPLNFLQEHTQVGPRADVLKSMKAYSDLAITAVQAIASLGTGLRLNLPQIMMTLHNNIPSGTDTEGTARAKLAITNGLMDDVERALLHARNPKAAAAQTGVAPANAAPGGKVERDPSGKLVRVK